MEYEITITMKINTTDYLFETVTPQNIEALVHDMIVGEADWPEEYKIAVKPL